MRFDLILTVAILPLAGCGKVFAQSNITLNLVTDMAIRSKEPRVLTETGEHAYVGMNFRLWESKSHKYRIDLISSFHGYFDGVFDLTHHYRGAVRTNEGHQMDLRQGLINITAPKWAVHVGRQQVVWGEAVGVFIADVVNPKDYRQFLIPDFCDIRIPLWAVDAQRSFGSAGMLEVFLAPDPRISRLPVSGAEFQFYGPLIDIPSSTTSMPRPITVGNSNIGIRYAWLRGGWDSAIFYHQALSDVPAISTHLLLATTNPLVSVRKDYPRVSHVGVTSTKPIGGFVLKGEALFTAGERFESSTLGDALRRESLSIMAGFSYPLCCQYTVDVQYFQTSLFGPSNQIISPGFRSGLSVRVADVASLRRFKPSILSVVSPNQHDYWISPKLAVRLTSSSFFTIGWNWFNGRIQTQFGQFRNASRIEANVLWKVM